MGRSFARDAAASFTTFAALMMPVLLGFAALGVDLGSFYLDARRLRGAVDLAAVAAAGDAAGDRGAAAERVGRILAANGFPDAVPVLQFGVYTPDPRRPVEARFVEAGTGVNAVRLRVAGRSPAHFAQVFRVSSFPLGAVSVAAVHPTASFSLSSRLASLDNGLINDILKGVLGAGISLGVLDGERLAAASLNAGRLTEALASLAGGASTAQAVLNHPIDAKAFLGIAGAVLRRSGDPAAAVVFERLSRGVETGALLLKGGDLIRLDTPGAIPLGAPQLDVDLNALDVLMASVTSSASRRTAIDVTHALGPASASLTILLGEAGRSTPLLAVGAVGTELQTAQLRLRLTVRLGGRGLLDRASIELPLQLLAGEGSAQLSAVSCAGSASERGATLGVTPGLVDAAIGRFEGSLADAAFRGRAKPATILRGLALAEVEADANLAAADPRASALAFDGADIASGRVKTVRTTSFVRSLAGDLLRDLRIEVTLLKLPLFSLLPVVPKAEIGQAVAAQLAVLAQPLDALLNDLTALLGVSLGEAHVRVDAVTCGAARLVF